MEAVHSWDHAGLALAHAARTPLFDSLFAAATWLGSLAVLLPLALLVWWRRRGERSAAFVALALIGASTLGHLAKLIAARSVSAADPDAGGLELSQCPCRAGHRLRACLATAIEALCDFIETRHNEKIKVIKDIAAAGVGIAIFAWFIVLGVELRRLLDLARP